MSDLTFVAYDTAPSVYGSLVIDGVPLDLTGATVRCQMRLTSDRRFKVDGAAVVLSPTAGTVRYDWGPDDLSTAGEYILRWEVTFGDGSIQHSEPENTITVDPE